LFASTLDGIGGVAGMECVSAHTNRAANKLPDALLVRYFREGKIEDVRGVTIAGDVVTVTSGAGDARSVELWRDLGGGLGFVPDADEGQ
jgi:hypothetical protein